MFQLLLAATALVAGGIASIAGFGIGSLLTPVLALSTGTKLAVAAVAIPHFVGTGLRFWMLRAHVDRSLLVGFGIASALGGLAGALAHVWVTSDLLSIVFGALLLLASASELTGWMERVKWGRAAAWFLGVLSGGFGGLVGNQGSIRSAAMLGFRVPKEAFVATATAVALMVDVARLPVYIATQGREIASIWPLILIATLGVVAGTVAGRDVLTRLPRRAFRRAIASSLLLLGVYMIGTATL